ISAQTLFFKEAMDKVGVKMEVFKVGTYKAAVEPFIATEMSAANREQLTAYTQSVWDEFLTGVSSARNIPKDILDGYASQLLEFQEASSYVKCGLVDTLLYQEGVVNYLKELTGRGEKEELRTLKLSEMNTLSSNETKGESENIIALYYADGEIDGSKTSMEGINSEKTIKELRKLREDENVKAVVLRINSPGGSAYGSEQIWQEVKALKEKKPVIVSMGDYAASGGYYIASPASYILANATTLTGSIGIFGMVPNAQELLTKKIGLHFDAVNTHPFSDLGSMGRSFKPEERAALQQKINEGYETFINRCAEGRNMDPEAIKEIGEGRIWTGDKAKELGLVDGIGGVEEAIKLAVQYADVSSYSLQSYPEKENFFSLMLNSKESFLQNELKKSMGSYFSTFQFIQNMTQMERVQARMPFELIID
ncbi:MAG: signal peptide peptidase SppA, partial [Phocaeicola sp.]